MVVENKYVISTGHWDGLLAVLKAVSLLNEGLLDYKVNLSVRSIKQASCHAKQTLDFLLFAIYCVFRAAVQQKNTQFKYFQLGILICNRLTWCYTRFSVKETILWILEQKKKQNKKVRFKSSSSDALSPTPGHQRNVLWQPGHCEWTRFCRGKASQSQSQRKEEKRDRDRSVEMSVALCIM